MSSQFAQHLAGQQSGFDFVAAHFECERNLYAPGNPDGFVNFGSAQNYLHPTALQERLATVEHSFDDTHYQAFTGTESCRRAVAEYLSVTSHPDPNKTVPVNADNIVLGNGIISLLEALAIALLDEGDNVLVPTPVFPGLVNALTLRVRSQVTYLHTSSDTGFRVTPDSIRKELRRQVEIGNRIRAVLLCSPGNPIGQVYSADEIREIAVIAAEFDCSLIVDEVYAGSCFRDDVFVSAIGLNNPNIYVLGGLSKDFGLAGYATGWIHATNKDVCRAVSRQSHFFRLPAPVQAVLEHVLSPSWSDEYLHNHRSVLYDRFVRTRTTLAGEGIIVSPTEAGLCTWIDLREVVRTRDAAGELELYQHLLNVHRVHISPGTGFHCAEPGFFRLCFSHDELTLLEGLRRLSEGVASFCAAHCLRLAEFV